MAGIAFRLQKLVSGDSYNEIIRAYLYSALISTGPFLIVIATLAFIKAGVQIRLTLEEGELLLSLVVYLFAFSMIGVAPFIYVVTRHLADQYYLKQSQAFSPTYLSILHIIFFIQGVTALIYVSYLQVSLISKWLLVCAYLFISAIWIAMIFLSAARNYLWIVWAFLIGGGVGIVAAIICGMHFGFEGFLFGFTAGQGLCFYILSHQIFCEFGLSSSFNYGFFNYFKKHPYLVAIGFFYYAGIWVDKLIFWFSDYGEVIDPVVRIYSTYDTPMFLAYLTVVPSVAFFLVQMETSFVAKYHSYYESIRKRCDYTVIQSNRHDMLNTLSNHFQKYALFQGIFSGLIILFIFEIADAFSLASEQMGVFRIGILGAFLQMGFVMILNIMFYFDFQKESCLLTGVFFILNALCTYFTLDYGLPAFGFGYTIASFGTCFAGFLILNYKLKYLDYYTFMQQPILMPKFKFESETAQQKKFNIPLAQMPSQK